jgi:hypothetical protein
MGISKPYQINQAWGLIKHIRPRNNATPSPGSYKRGTPDTEVKWYPLTHHRAIQCMYHGFTGNKLPTGSPGFQLSTILLFNMTPWNFIQTHKPRLPLCLKPALHFGSSVSVCYVNILSNHLLWLTLPSAVRPLQTCSHFSPFLAIVGSVMCNLRASITNEAWNKKNLWSPMATNTKWNQ